MVAYKKGDRIGDDYEVRDVIGAGGFGIVYLVYHRQTKSAYALKTFRDEFLNDERTRGQFRKEARIWIELERHPNLVRAYQVTEFQGRLFVALEYIAPNEDGLNSLDGYLRQSQPELRQSLEWAIQFCDGMIHAHAKGIRCHRDIKPANIMVTQNQILKISDVGLAGVFSATPKSKGVIVNVRNNGVGMSLLTVEGAVGTPTHMPPEQFTDAALCDARSDIYSFGVVLYQMRNHGQLPFFTRLPQDNSENEMMRFWAEMRKLHAQAPVPKLNSRLQPIIQRCLEKDAGRRYQTFDQLRRDLAAVLKEDCGQIFIQPPIRDLEAWELCNKGAALAELGQDDQALVYYDEALRLTPRFANAWNNKGISLKKAGRTTEALGCFDEAIRIDPRLPHAWANKGDCLGKLKRYRDAISCLDRALNLDSSSAGCWLNKGNILLGLGHMHEAGKCFANAIRLNPLYAAAWYRQGLCNQALREMDEAIRCFDKSIELHPAKISAWCSKASCLSALGRNEEALRVISDALCFAPLSPVGWFIKAGIEEQLNRVSEAATSLRRLLAEPGDADAEVIEYAKQRLGELR